MKRVRKGEARSAQTGELVKASGVSVRAEEPRENGTMSPWRVPRPMPRAIGADSREGLGVPGGNLVEPSREASKSGVEAVEE